MNDSADGLKGPWDEACVVFAEHTPGCDACWNGVLCEQGRRRRVRDEHAQAVVLLGETEVENAIEEYAAALDAARRAVVAVLQARDRDELVHDLDRELLGLRRRDAHPAVAV